MNNKNNTFMMTAKTHYGLENVLAVELKDLGASNIIIQNRAVSFRGDRSLMYRANLSLRTAIRILKPIFEFRARNEDELYNNIYNIDWSEHLNEKQTLAINSAVHSQYFKHSKYAALKTKDAIVDQFRNNKGLRPSISLDDPDIRIHLHIEDAMCTVSLDSSGDSLHKRGYRSKVDLAPLNEVLAAGLILLSGWKRDTPFIDPMCGAGTLLIEAALYANNIAPSIYRKKFGFEKWGDFEKKLWNDIRDKAERNVITHKHAIIGSDRSKRAIEIASHNIISAGINDKIKLSTKSIDNVLPLDQSGICIINPPYGERLKHQDIKKLYRSIGDKLKKDFSGYTVWIFSSNKTALKSIGLRTSQKIKLYNGKLECTYRKFEIYS